MYLIVLLLPFSRKCTDVFPFVEPVYAVDPSPESAAIFLAAGEDGTLKLCDVRAKNCKLKCSYCFAKVCERTEYLSIRCPF